MVIERWNYPYIKEEIIDEEDYVEGMPIVPDGYVSTGVKKPFLYGHFHYDCNLYGDHYMQFIKVVCDESTYDGRKYYSFHYHAQHDNEYYIETFDERRIGYLPADDFSSELEGMDVILPVDTAEEVINLYKKTFISRLLSMMYDEISGDEEQIAILQEVLTDVREALDSEQTYEEICDLLYRKNIPNLLEDYSLEFYSDNMKSNLLFQALTDRIVRHEIDLKKIKAAKNSLIDRYYKAEDPWREPIFHDESHKIWEQEEVDKLGCDYFRDISYIASKK